MKNLEHLNNISDETFNEFLNSFSPDSKHFMEQIFKGMNEQGIVLTTNSLKESFVSYLSYRNFERKSDPLLVYLRENQVKYGEEIIRIFEELEPFYFHLISLWQKNVKNKSDKKEIFLILYDTIEKTLTQLGYTYRTTEFAQQVERQLSELIYMYFETENKFRLRELATISFLQDMLKKLVERGSLSKNFQNESTQIRWIHGAFNIDFHNINQLEKEKLKIDWNNLNELANWLLFLKKYCIVYDHDNNKQLYEWVIAHVSYNGQHFSKDASIYRSLVNSIKKRQGTENKYWCLDDNKQLKIKYAPSKGRA